MHERILPRIRIGLVIALASSLAGCLDRNGGQFDTTVVDSSGSSGSTGSSGGGEQTTFPGIMTTTEDPGDSEGDSGATGEPPPPACGNGKIDPPELCDQGEANADDAECTSQCRWNVCDDGLVKKDEELCDDGPDNGKYGHCADNCDGLAERCGDGIAQPEHGELCDESDATIGCLKDCTWGSSCVDIKASWGDEVSDGLFVIHPKGGEPLTVWCDMDADGGGYTFLKYASGAVFEDDPDNPFIPQPLSAAQAEAKCAAFGLRLFSPRTAQHLAAAIGASNATEFAPVQTGGPFPPIPEIDSDVAGYLKIMGIYPVTPGASCVGQPLNSDDCPEWAAKPPSEEPGDVMPFWVTDEAIANEPSTNNCAGCSLYYNWTVDPPALVGYKAVNLDDTGATSAHFLCELADKLGPSI